VEPPETRYVKVGDADVAYQVVGSGPSDLLFCYGLGSNVERWWEFTESADILTRLSSRSRLIFFDRRGTGASDGVPNTAVPTWEEWAEDIDAVLQAAGSDRCTIMGALDAGPIAMLFTAMHPERVNSLVLLNTTARYEIDDGYPIGAPPEAIDFFVQFVGATWGTLDYARMGNPGISDEVLKRYCKIQRSSATPRSAAAQYDYILHRDIRHLLSLIQVPTLVLHVRDNPILSIDHGRYLTEHIENATFIELPGSDISTVSPDSCDRVIEFLTGERPNLEIDRVLTTVLFTDTVGSTQRAAALGDNHWRSLLDSHDDVVRDLLQQYRGREIKTTGDGFLVAFDGPARAIRCADAIVGVVREIDLEVRAGIHTGECEMRGDDLGGLAVHIASRVGSLAGEGEVLVSGTVRDLVVGSGIEFDDRGEHELKGVPGSWKLFAFSEV
jgi:class 3 adenylate cyclase